MLLFKFKHLLFHNIDKMLGTTPVLCCEAVRLIMDNVLVEDGQKHKKILHESQ